MSLSDLIAKKNKKKNTAFARVKLKTTETKRPLARGRVEAAKVRRYLSLSLGPGQLHLFQHLRPLLHHQGLLVGEGRDVVIVLREDRNADVRRARLVKPPH